MRILVACEESQVVCKEFRLRGHEAFSCDLQECSGGYPQWHIQGDVTKALGGTWDMIIAFPPCTDLAVSGARHFAAKRADGRQQASIDFFRLFTNLDCPKVAIENPVSIMSTQYRKPDQIIQPWQFGHTETKATCLWLKGLPLLRETRNVKDYMKGLPNSIKNRIHYMSPGPERARERSKTFLGIARAMAEQWG